MTEVFKTKKWKEKGEDLKRECETRKENIECQKESLVTVYPMLLIGTTAHPLIPRRETFTSKKQEQPSQELTTGRRRRDRGGRLRRRRREGN